MKNWTPSKRQTTPTKCPKAQRRLTDLLFGQHPKSARELFCEQRKKEVLSQAPNTALDELDDLLRDDWSSLTPDQRLEYEDRAKQSRGNRSSTSTQLRPAQPVVPSPRSDVRRKEATSTRAVVQLPFCMKSVREKLGNYCELSQQPLSRETTLIIGRLPDAPKEVWLVCHKGKLATLNITCLREAALFRKLKQTYIVPAEELRPPLVVTASMLPDPALWSVLGRLKQERRDQSGFSYVVDPLLTSNGFHLRLVPGHPNQKADIVRKASGVDLAHLGQILDRISRSASDSVAVEEVRPPSVLELLKREAKRMVHGSVPSPLEDVRDGAEELDELCLHGNAICAAFFDTKDVSNM
ncbi:PMS1 protein homolog 1 [Ixodes scapularis]